MLLKQKNNKFKVVITIFIKQLTNSTWCNKHQAKYNNKITIKPSISKKSTRNK